jgi:hypothetical protein
MHPSYPRALDVKRLTHQHPAQRHQVGLDDVVCNVQVERVRREPSGVARFVQGIDQRVNVAQGDRPARAPADAAYRAYKSATMTFASRTTSAIVEARRVLHGVRGLALQGTDRRANGPPGRDHVTMRLGSGSLGSGNDGATLAIGKLGELTHELCVRPWGVRRRGHLRSIVPRCRGGKAGSGTRSPRDRMSSMVSAIAAWALRAPQLQCRPGCSSRGRRE